MSSAPKKAPAKDGHPCGQISSNQEEDGAHVARIAGLFKAAAIVTPKSDGGHAQGTPSLI